MSDKLYSIKESTLTDIGDALRRKHGETETITVSESVGETQISKSTNSVGFGTYNGYVGDNLMQTITIEGAQIIKVKVGYRFQNTMLKLYIDTGVHTSYTTMTQGTKLGGTTQEGEVELEFQGDTLTFYLYTAGSGTTSGNYGYYAECNGYVTEKEVLNTYKSSEMAQAIDDIEVGDILPEEAFAISGDCQYRFAYNNWNWYLDLYGDRITTKDVISTTYMFFMSHKIVSIPCEINCQKSSSRHNLNSTFSSCESLTSIPKINDCTPEQMSAIFQSCKALKKLPEDIGDWFDWSFMEKQTSGYMGNKASMFHTCCSLRSVPNSLLERANPNSTYSYAYFYNGFTNCYTLDELVDLPIPYTATWTSNAFYSTIGGCYRLKNFTFAMPDGQPYIVNWKSQTLDFSSNVGYLPNSTQSYIDYIVNYNSGITQDKLVTNEATYQALKNDPDWFTASSIYSRYNKTSAVNTINSLPDTSAYLATQSSGTNTIKFKGAAGSLTDGGAINTLTEEEIAVATARGWTVSLV